MRRIAVILDSTRLHSSGEAAGRASELARQRGDRERISLRQARA